MACFQGAYRLMQLDHTQTYTTEAPSIRPQRIVSVDLLRGLAMILMALDHTRDYFSGLPFPPEDLNHTFGALFFTRVITHLGAPVFYLLTGTGAYLSVARGKTVRDVSRFFWTRGLWLIFLELTVVRFAWDFTFNCAPVLQTFWALGWSMIVMALIVRLPTIWIGVLGMAIIGLHNLLDSVSPGSLGNAAGLWNFLHVPGLLSITPQISVLVGYTLIPWVGVMAAGYALGALLEKPDRRKRIFLLGVGLTLAFFILRFINLYGNGDPSQPSFFPWTVGPWKFQASPTLSVIAFFNTLKYPPSLDHLLQALGPALIILAGLDGLRAERGLGRILLVFGRVPLFFYVLHVFLIHTSAVLVGLLFHQPVAWLWQGDFVLSHAPATYGHPLVFVYATCVLVLAILYVPCKWYAAFKSRHRDWPLLSYV
jgi:uncharacterized membrane protein